MIITRTPLRISLVGGGTDLPAYYREYGPGAVVSFAIDKYMNIVVNEPMEDKVRVSYSTTEIVDWATELKHELARNCLILHGIARKIEILSVADIPGRGTGLGSSSAYTVGLTRALDLMQCKVRPLEEVAEEACKVEIDLCEKPIGKQDQYACAIGGLNYMTFEQDDRIRIKPITLTPERVEEFGKRFLLFYTGMTRDANAVLKDQTDNLYRNQVQMEEMAAIANELYADLATGNFKTIGEKMMQNWRLKKGLARAISNPAINAYVNVALNWGAEGVKLCGAGGGGFLLVYAHQAAHPEIIAHMGLPAVRVAVEPHGCRMIWRD